jgi:hypothetical protein
MPPHGTEVLRLDDIDFSAREVAVRWSVDDRHFQTTYWYGSVDLGALVKTFGDATINDVLFHIALFEINKGGSLRPRYVDLGDWARGLTQPLAALWRTVFRNVWGQWRYEHDDPGYDGPDFAAPPVPQEARPVTRELGGARYLSFCGGGKDSLVAARLLEGAGLPYHSFAYAHSIYGKAGPQLDLIGGLERELHPATFHRQWVFDDFLESPVTDLEPDLGVHLLLAAETPSSIFASLPVVLGHQFSHVVLSHERSANVGNLVWAATGEAINHQWGKSYAAEQLIDTYIRENLVSDFSYFSILQPVCDSLIFAMLRDLGDAIKAAHSCNVAKPWCMRCPKCAYVWVSYKAWLSWERVDSIFAGTNLLELPENQPSYREMLGLADHTPFECIGQVDEARLAFAMAHKRGLRGEAMEMFEAEVGLEHDWLEIARPLLAVGTSPYGIPPDIAPRLLSRMMEASHEATAYLEELFG